MSNFQMVNTNSRNESDKFGKAIVSIISKYFVAALVIITTLVVFIPLNPEMPLSGLDSSWVFSMNEAVAHNLKIGKEVIFSFGPYASIYTQTYHPATKHLMIFGSLFLGLCYIATLLYLAKDRTPYRLLLFFVFLVGFMYSRDSLLFSYLLLVAICTTKYILEVNQNKRANNNLWQILLISLIFTPLGLLPLVKGSLLLICGGTAVVVSSYSMYYRNYKLALIALISPIVSTTIFWVLSGQSILSLLGYFISMLSIISGYTEAMSLHGNRIEIFVSLLAAIVIIWVIITSHELSIPTKIFLSICFAQFLFVSFKGGFVRHDMHAIIAGNSLVFAALIGGFIFGYKRLSIMLLVSIVTMVYIGEKHDWISTKIVFTNISKIYAGTWAGLRSRVTESDNLRIRYERSLEKIRREYPIPALQGTMDIYSFDQSYLLASENRWNPRPIFQSYSAYTEELAIINEQHLRGNNAPDNVLFRLQTIDGRLPSLDDGFSWPALFDNYTVTKLDNGLAYLKKKQTTQSSSIFYVIHEEAHRTGVDVEIPAENEPIYAEVDLKPTLLGRFLGILFKPPHLKLTLKLKDGTSKDYRVLSQMMKPGFFVSPLIENTNDFVFLTTGIQCYPSSKVVESMAITPSYGSSVFWGDTYALRLKSYRGEVATNLPEIFFDRISDSIPEGYAESTSVRCDGAIDVVNGVSPVPQNIKMSCPLSVEGWLAVSAKDGIVPDDIFVTLKDLKGTTKYINTRRTPRVDVKAYFNQTAMPDVGFTINVFVTAALNGEYVLGLARGYKGKIEQCDQFNVHLKVVGVD